MGACCSGNSATRDRRVTHEIDARMRSDEDHMPHTHRVLLLGPGESGKSTILKQMTKIYRGSVSQDVLHWTSSKIQDEVADIMKTLCKASIALDTKLETPDDGSDIEAIRESMSQLQFGSAITPELVAQMKLLWANKGIQKTLAQRNKFQIPDHAAYWFDLRLDSIYLSDSYVATFDDYLRLRVRSTGFFEETFTKSVGELLPGQAHPTRADSHSDLVPRVDLKGKDIQHRFTFIDVGGQRCERKKWLNMLKDNIKCIVYVVAVSEYDMLCFEDETTPRITEALRLFTTVLEKGFMEGKATKTVTIFLNKYDLLVAKLTDETKPSFKDCFEDFPQDKNGRDPSHVCEYVFQLFNQVFQEFKKDYPLHYHCTTAISVDQIQRIFHDITADVIKATIARTRLL
eukprot:173834_1